MHEEISPPPEPKRGDTRQSVTASEDSEAQSCQITPETLRMIELDQQQFEVIVRSVPGGHSNVQDVYPLSPLQEGMLFHHLLNERSVSYVLSTMFELDSEAQLASLIHALQKVIDRHDVLRSAVLWEELPKPVQVVYRRAELPVAELALGSDKNVIEQLKELMRSGEQSLELRRAPIALLQVTPDVNGKRYALLRLHHLVCDHQSLRTLVAETMACLRGHEQTLPTPLAYRNYVMEALKDAETPEGEAFFRSKLGEVDEPTAPFGVLDVHGSGTRIEEAQLKLGAELGQKIRMQARRMGVSAARLFHAAWALVVARTSGSDDVVFGTVVLAAQQRNPQARRMLGMSVNTLPLRLRLRDASVQQLVEQTHRELTQLLRYEHAPLVFTQRFSGIAGTAPLFTTLLNCRRSEPNAGIECRDEIGVRWLAQGEAWTNYPITLLLDDLTDEFLLTAQTDCRIDPHRILRYLDTALKSLTGGLEHAPGIRALALPLLPEGERKQLIEVFNATQVAYPQDELIHQLFEAQVERTPQAVAAVYENESLSYAELNCRANQLAWYLREQGVGTDQLVGICVERSLEMVVGLLGILKAGAAYVPLDPSYPAERLAYMMKDAAPRVLLIQEGLRARLPTITAPVIALDAQWAQIKRHRESNPDPNAIGVTARHLAYVIYTSGSTGQPKGAMNEHRALINRLHWMQDQYHMSASDRVLQKTPFSFDVAGWEFFWTLMTGAGLIIARPQGHQDPTYLRRLIEATGVTTLHFVPSMLLIFLDQHRAGQCSSLRHVVCSGEELSPSLQRRCLELLPHARLSNLYGPTETAIDVTFWECGLDTAALRVPIGRPIANTQIYVLDSYRQPVPIGVAGEIFIGGRGVGRGYVNRPELTARRFVPDAFNADASARLYQTGDLGRYRGDGAIEYLGRNDHQVKIRGLRIELGEIEAQLAHHEQVRETAVMARGDAGEKRLVAYLVARDPQATPTAEQLRAYLATVLPEYMVPNAFVILERLPLSANGKLDRRALPAPGSSAYVSRVFEPPEGDLETFMAQTWQSLLGLERVGRRDNFFELGGHSLLAMQAIARAQAWLCLEIPIRLLFEYPTLRELVTQIEELRTWSLARSVAEGGAEVDELLERVSSLPPSQVQELLQQFAREGTP